MNNVIQKLQLNITSVGKSYLFYIQSSPENQYFGLSSQIEKIGQERDVILKNNTKVIILSDPTIINTDCYGKISICLVLAHVAVWVRTDSLIEILG